ncbi:MAG: hypothetical protein QGH94_19950 [Phycisphaerae bacterium]|nr:hypothetical protein [Phycisphaerae bacterium]
MRMIAMLRISMVALVLGALTLTTAHAAEEPPPISITAKNLKEGLSPSDVKQVQAHAEYWVSELTTAKRAGGIYTAREGLMADYNKYGDSSIRFKVEFARSVAAIVPATMGKLTKADRLKPQKEVNFALAISKMTQLTAISALDTMVTHSNPGVRFLAWRGFRAIRNDAIRAGGPGIKTLSAALAKQAGAEPNPLVADAIVDVLYIKKSEWASNAFKKTFDSNFKTLVVMQKTSCSRLAVGDADWTRPCITAIPMLKDASDFYKPDSKAATLILQQLLDIAYAGAKAYAAAGGEGIGAFQCTPLLLQVEPAIGSLSGNSGTEICEPLLSKKMSADEKKSAIRRGVLDWVDRLEDLGVKTPVFKPIKAPKPTTQPATTKTTS